MPTYEYRCEECGATFERVEHVKEHDASEPRCPKCDSKKVAQILETFFAKTSTKS